jgi:hypothetical protein
MKFLNKCFLRGGKKEEKEEKEMKKAGEDKRVIKWLFKEHPKGVGETWWQHARFACGEGCLMLLGALRLFLSAILFFIHAAFPAFPIWKPFDLMSNGKMGDRFYKTGVERDEQRRRIQKRKD